MQKKFHFTKEAIEKLPYPIQQREEYRDTKIVELRLRVTRHKNKTFSLHKRMRGTNGKLIRVTLGKFPDMKLSVAREQAIKILAEIAVGVNPNLKRNSVSYTGMTLRFALELYIKLKNLSPRTIVDYRSLLRCQLSIFSERDLVEITGDEIAALHKSISSPARADYSMRLLRAIYNFINTESVTKNGEAIFVENPVKIISHRKQWNNVGRKQNHIRIKEFPAFAKAIIKIRMSESQTGKSICDALVFALISGLRQSEILNLKWTDVNERGEFFTIRNTKNSDNLELPITNHIRDIFQARMSEEQSEFVFSAQNVYGQVRTPRKVVLKVIQESGTDCHFHDLRRTFATTGEHLDVGQYKLKRLMGHRSGRNDVTEGYVILTAETLRSSSIKIQEQIINYMEIPLDLKQWLV